jgi:hypothetical protein
MFRFTVQGRIGSIKEYKNNVVRVSVAAERIVQGRSDNYTATEWAPCVSFDPNMNRKLMADLSVGQNVTIEGIIVPRPRDKNAEKKIFDLSLEIVSFQPGARPKAKAAKSAESDTADATA